MRVYRVLLDPADAGTVIGEDQAGGTRLTNKTRAIAAAAVVLLMAGGGLWWSEPWTPEYEPASAASMTYPLPDKPSIAVMSFDNMSGDPTQDYFADGMTEDIITDLSKISGLFVIARNTTFAYKGTPTKIGQVAEDLGVRYVLEGSVRRVGDQVRINVQLIDATRGHLWAERYDGKLDDIFALQDKVNKKIVTALSIELTVEEQSQFKRDETTSSQAHDAFLRGWAYYRRDTPEDLAKAVPYLRAC